LNQSYTKMSDATLAQAAKRDVNAFDALYHRYADRVYRYCYARTHNRADAEDLTAQTFLACLESLKRYREHNTFAAWLFRIARNTCAHYHRENYAHPESELLEDCPLPNVIGLSENADTNAQNPEQAAIRHALRDCLHRAMRILSSDRREALRLRFWGGLSAREAAQVMRRDASAIKMLVWRGINDLRKRCVDEA